MVDDELRDLVREDLRVISLPPERSWLPVLPQNRGTQHHIWPALGFVALTIVLTVIAVGGLIRLRPPAPVATAPVPAVTAHADRASLLFFDAKEQAVVLARTDGTEIFRFATGGFVMEGSIALSPRGDRIAYWRRASAQSGPYDLESWTIQNRTPTTVLHLAGEVPWGAPAFSADGIGLVAAVADAVPGSPVPPSRSRLVLIRDGRVSDVLVATQGAPFIPLRADATRVAGIRSAAAVRWEVIDLSTGRTTQSMEMPSFRSIRVSSDSSITLAVFGETNGNVEVWRTFDRNQVVANMPGPRSDVLIWPGRPEILLTTPGSTGTLLRAFNYQTNEEREVGSLRAASSPVGFDPEGAHLLVANSNAPRYTVLEIDNGRAYLGALPGLSVPATWSAIGWLAAN